MKKIYPYYLLCSSLCVTIGFAGCNKMEEDEELARKKVKTVNNCKISSMTYLYDSDSVEVTITYNEWDDPVRVTQTSTGTGRPDGIFKYDNKRRLTDYIGAYNHESFEFWHRYVYDNKSRVIRDTTYFFGFIDNDGPDLYYDLAIVEYEYDHFGRIAHTSQHWFNDPGNPLHTYYSYDGNGNLVIPGVTYDDKISIHRTNNTWMFIGRNYSINNAYATAWNTNGLPLQMGLSDQGGRFAGFYYGRLNNIQYQCKGDVESSF